MKLKRTRASLAGQKMADAIIEGVHLMYQNKTAIGYLSALIIKLNGELIRREKEATGGDDGKV